MIRFPIALWVEAGLVGGVKSAAWRRGCDESQEKADGRSIFGMLGKNAPSLAVCKKGLVMLARVECLCATPSDRVVKVRDRFATGEESVRVGCEAMRCARGRGDGEGCAAQE